MNRARILITVIGLLVVGGMAGLGYWLGALVEGGPSASPRTPAAATPSPTATPAPSAPSPTGAPGAAPRPTPAPSPTVKAAATPAPARPLQEARATLVLEPLPLSARRGQTLVVRWRLQGGAPLRGTATRLIASRLGAPTVVSPSAGPFTLPARFEATVRPEAVGELRIVIEAVFGGETLRAEHRLRVE